MLYENLHCGFNTTRNFNFSINLCPETWYWSSYLSEWVNMRSLLILFFILFGFHYYLLAFNKVRSVAFIVNAARVVSSSTQQPSASWYQYQVNVQSRLSMPHISLNQWYHPIRRNVLNAQLFIKIVVPHVAIVKGSQSFVRLCLWSCQESISSLSIWSKIEAIRSNIKSTLKKFFDSISNCIHLKF